MHIAKNERVSRQELEEFIAPHRQNKSLSGKS